MNVASTGGRSFWLLLSGAESCLRHVLAVGLVDSLTRVCLRLAEQKRTFRVLHTVKMAAISSAVSTFLGARTVAAQKPTVASRPVRLVTRASIYPVSYGCNSSCCLYGYT